MSSWLPYIFDYLDYRSFLADYYQAAKANMPQFSYRYFSQHAGFSSSNFLKLVTDGKRNISHESIDKFASVIGLGTEEYRFFKELVLFDQAETPKDKQHHLESILATKRFREAKPIDGLLFDYLSHWYHVPIREMIVRSDFREDPDWIAQQLQPSITPTQARQALQTLEEIGLVMRDPNGHLTQGEPTLDAGHEVQAVCVRAYHQDMIQLAADSIDTVDAHLRDISAITVCIKASSIEALKQRLRLFREQVLVMCDAEEDPEMVYQLTMQLFPLTKQGDNHAL